MSIQDLQQNPQDTSNFYLSNIYQATINPNESSSLPTSPPPFTPPNFAIWVNALWFLSLVISITCALLATLLQQWARRYLKVTHSRYSPHKRARIRTFFSEGIDKFLLPWAVEALPTMLHLSLFLFFAGLAVFLWNVNLTIFKLVLSWIGLCISLYGCITFIPVFCHDSPYHTPLSLPVWHLITGIPFLTFRVLETISLSSDWFSYETYERFERLAERYGHLLVQGMQKTAEESALRSSSEIDARAFMWTFDCLDEDHELERFFSGLPGFRSSKVVEDPLPWLTSDQEGKLLNAVIGLLDRTSSDLLPEPVKVRRNVICAKAIGPVNNPLAMLRVLRRIVSEDQYGPVQTSEIARLVKGWDNGKDEETTIIRAIASSVIVRAQRRDDLWYAMASDEMGVSESILRNHATHGNNLSLSILVHVIRQQFSHVLDQHWPWSEFWKVLKTTSEFDVRNTSPELQHEFCALWNEVVRFEDWKIRRYILRPIHNTYLMLHPHTDSTQTQIPVFTNDDDDAALLQLSMYPLCSTPGHHPDSMSISHDAYPYTAISDTVLHDTAVPVPVSLDTTPNVPSPSAPAPENTVDVPLLNDGVSAPVSSHPAHPPAAESLSVPVILPDPQAATGAALRDVDTYPRTILSGSLTSAASVPPTGDLSLQGNTDLLVYSDTEISSPAPEPDLENILKTGTYTADFVSPMVDSDQVSCQNLTPR